jgi:hypothetical protein
LLPTQYPSKKLLGDENYIRIPMPSQIPVPSALVANLLVGACPERKDEFAKFWEQFQPRFVLKQDGVGSALSACGSKVSWMHKTFAHDWVVAFAGFKAQIAYAPHVLLAKLNGGEISARALCDDDGLSDAEAALDELLYFAKSILVVDDLDELIWPLGLPSPGMRGDQLHNNEEQACFDIACLATAASFLHELRHVQFAADGDAPIAIADEERACDDYSRTMLLEKIEVYCSGTGEATNRVASKRVIGLATAALTIAQAEAHSMASAIQSTHPPISERFLHLVLQAEVEDNEDCWSYVACLLIALLRRSARLPEQVQFSTLKQLCQQLAVML